MIAPLLILVAHGLDGLTLVMATNVWGFGGESNSFAHMIYAALGLRGLLLA